MLVRLVNLFHIYSPFDFYIITKKEGFIKIKHTLILFITALAIRGCVKNEPRVKDAQLEQDMDRHDHMH